MNIDGEFYQLLHPRAITFRHICSVKVVCPADRTRSRLAQDEETVPGTTNNYVEPVNEVVQFWDFK